MSSFSAQLITRLFRFLSSRRARFSGVRPCKNNAHLWRTIAEPYSRQCRLCGAVQFREDKNGGFPDGLAEYFAYVSRLPPERRLIAPAKNICHCGATMVFKADCYQCGGPMILADDQRTGRIAVWYCRKCERVADDTEKPIWFCEICESWKVVENS